MILFSGVFQLVGTKEVVFQEELEKEAEEGDEQREGERGEKGCFIDCKI